MCWEKYELGSFYKKEAKNGELMLENSAGRVVFDRNEHKTNPIAPHGGALEVVKLYQYCACPRIVSCARRPERRCGSCRWKDISSGSCN